VKKSEIFLTVFGAFFGLYIVLAIIPLIFYKSLLGYHIWGIFNKFSVLWISRHITNDRVLLILVTSFVNGLLIGIATGTLAVISVTIARLKVWDSIRMLLDKRAGKSR
jgi:hypothetical protein